TEASGSDEPGLPPERRKDYDIQIRASLIDDMIFVACDNVEPVAPRRKFRIDSFGKLIPFRPNALVVFKLVFEQNFLWGRQAQRCEIDLKSLLSGGHRHCLRKRRAQGIRILELVIYPHAFNYHRRRIRIARKQSWIQGRKPRNRREQEFSVARPARPG